MQAEITLTDLFDVEMLQRIQDSFANMTGLAAQITDANGKPITRGSNYTNFCSKYTRKSILGCIRCEQCDKHGAEIALKSGSSITYYCHAGLLDFAAPIMAGDTMIGCFVGGQVLTEPPDITKIMQVAAEIDVDLINYLQSVLEVPIVERSKLENAANFLYTLTNILSTISYHKYRMHQANIEIEKMANMKSDFLANMSHEIRTPMNAVIGLAEMALREDLPPNARDYINQIKTSGKTLLTIINDILDFSKVESGKMTIMEEEYEPLSVIHDVSSIISTRLDKDDVEFILDMNPSIPRRLVGDNVRLKQIIINLANNAVKFTKSGQVKLTFDYKQIDENGIDLLFSVKDTGIGIKQTDLPKLFQSFQQLDSKRNRNLEGSGLGLAISKQLLLLMHGDIQVESTYGEGSTFSFHLPQRVIDTEPSIQIEHTDAISETLYGYITNPYITQQLQEDLNRLGYFYQNMSSINELQEITKDYHSYLFLEATSFTPEMQTYVSMHPQLTAVILVHFKSTQTYDIPNVITAKKPLSALFLAAIFNEDFYSFDHQELTDEYYDYIAPDAKILIVDDNTVNLTVCEGLLEPLAMQIETAISGQETMEKISNKTYDLILMDHMMPEIDGVETTHLIRRFHREYDHVPIIALTANAVSGIKDMFIAEGMNDFIAKPIEVRVLVSTIKRWLPKHMIKHINPKNIQAGIESRNLSTPAPAPVIKDLDTAAALKLLGSAKLFWNVLDDYYHSIPKKHNLIQQYLEAKDWTNYTIEVHSLKSASKQIGATKLSELAAELEAAGHALEEPVILEKTPTLLELYMHYQSILAVFFPEAAENDMQKPIAEKRILFQAFEQLQGALDDLDMDGMESVRDQLSQYRYDDVSYQFYLKLCTAISELDPEACENIMDDWMYLLT